MDRALIPGAGDRNANESVRPDASARVTFVAALAIALLLVPIYVTALRVPAFGLFHDDGVYLVTAKALAEGHGYRIISLPDEPRQTKYPPLFPALLAVVWHFGPAFPSSLWLLKLVPFGASLVWFWLTWRLYGTLQVPAALRPIAVLLVSTAPLVMYMSVTVLSETVFAALCTGTLLLLEAPLGHDVRLSRSRIVGAAMLGAAAVLTRIAGIALVVAVGAWLLFYRRDLRRTVLFGGVVVVCLLPWAVWVVTAVDSGFYGASNYASWNIFTSRLAVDSPVRARVLLTNAVWTLDTFTQAFGLPWHPISKAVLAATMIIGVRACGLARRASGWFLCVYLLLILGWAWPPSRFVLVVAPLALWLTMAGIPRTQRAIQVVAALLLVLSGLGAVRLAAVAHRASQEGAVNLLPDGDRWDDIIAVADRIRERTAHDERLVGNLDPVYYLLTGRKALRGLEPDPFRMFYAPDSGPPFGSIQQSWAILRRSSAGLLIDGPDTFFTEGPYLDSRYEELTASGDLNLIERIGPYRIFRINSGR